MSAAETEAIRRKAAAKRRRRTLRGKIAEAEERADAMRDWAVGWILRAREALYRDGWEEGMSATEAADALTSVLFNCGADAGSERPADIAEAKRLLALPLEYCPPGCRRRDE